MLGAPRQAACETSTVSNMKVAVACCRRSGEADPSDLYPDPDAGPLQAALRDVGAESTLVSWDDPTVAWDGFSHVVVSSTWDSVDRPAEYLNWARTVSDLSLLVNSVEVIEWNLDKAHQRELAAAGIAVIPTAWVAPGDAWEPPEHSEFVVKPSVSAGGRSTARYFAGDETAIDHVRRLQASGQTVMVQDYLPSIDTAGEVDVIFFAGRYSHSVLKKPALRSGQGVVDRPWERMEWSGLTTPTRMQLEAAASALEVVRSCVDVGEWPAYGRVDLIDGAHGEPLLLEVELIDPYLSLDMEPAAAARLAEAVIRS